jgi:hypothetical protein
MFRLCLFLAAFGLIAMTLAVSAQSTDKRGRKYKPPLPTAHIEVTVVRDVNGKPIEHAAVVFHPMQGERDKGNMELKTNEDGKAVIDVLPIGDTVRLQIISHGFQTYGEDYKIDKAAIVIEIRMKRPGEQYSIYKPHAPGEALGGKTPDAGKTDNPPAGTAPAPADKHAAQPEAQPSQPQPK